MHEVLPSSARPPEVLAVALSPLTFETLRELIPSRADRMLDIVAFAHRLGTTRHGAMQALCAAEDAFVATFGVRIVKRDWAGSAVAEQDRAPDGEAATNLLPFSSAFLDLIDRAPVAVKAKGPIPLVGGDVAVWMAAIAVSATHGVGSHFAFRARGQ